MTPITIGYFAHTNSACAQVYYIGYAASVDEPNHASLLLRGIKLASVWGLVPELRKHAVRADHATQRTMISLGSNCELLTTRFAFPSARAHCCYIYFWKYLRMRSVTIDLKSHAHAPWSIDILYGMWAMSNIEPSLTLIIFDTDAYLNKQPSSD